MQEIQDLIDRLAADDPSFKATARCFFTRAPFEVPRDAGIVGALSGAVSHATGTPPRYVGDTPWMDSALLAGAGIETVVFGPAGAGAHADVEWVDVESMVHCAAALAAAAVEYCG
jgi:acetylornithine deacetylase